jgi:hypothetical protein
VDAVDAFPLTEARCAGLLGPRCASRFVGARSVVAVPFADERGGPGRLELVLVAFGSVEQSYAAYTRLLVGDADPLQLEADALDAEGLFALAGGRVIGTRGAYLAMVEYTSLEQTLDERARAARERLPGVARALAEALPGQAVPPEAVLRLPLTDRIPLGVRFFVHDALGVAGLGQSAQGYYRSQERRWRVLSIVRPDVESAEDLMSTLKRHPDSHKLKYAPLDAMRFVQRREPGQPPVRWMVGRRGRVLYGIGDEATALPGFLPAEEEARVKLNDHEKLLKLSRIHLG